MCDLWGVLAVHEDGAHTIIEQGLDTTASCEAGGVSLHLVFGCHITGPMIHGANSSSPTPDSSLLLCLPEATATISSKI